MASVLSNASLRAGLRHVCAEMRIDDLDLPLAAVVADIVTQREVMLQRGLLWWAVLASMSNRRVYPANQLANSAR